MNKTMTLIMALLCVTMSFAQNEFINYKALVKDNNGVVVANQTISIKLTIIQTEDSTESPVYSETHTVTTDENGLIMLDIGNGTSSLGSFAGIEWRADIIDEDYLFTTHLKVEVDLTGGSTYVDLGTTEFKAVPYALDVLNHGLVRKASGWMLETEASFDDLGIVTPGDWAIDMTLHANADVMVGGAGGDFAFAAGKGNYAAGTGSVAFGEVNVAIGDFSTVSGYYNYIDSSYSFVNGLLNNAEGGSSFIHGLFNDAYGGSSTVFGVGLNADAYHSFTIGRYNVGGGDNATWIESDPIFEIGNGSNDANRSNSLTILKNGTLIAPSLTNALIDVAGDKALVTKEYADSKVSAGLEQLIEGANTGWRLIGKDPSLYDDIGDNAVDLSNGGAAGASGLSSFALGFNNSAEGEYSVVTGENSIAKGNKSFAGGTGSSAIGLNSFSYGEDTDANGNSSVALGLNTIAPSYAEMVLGANNTNYIPISSNQWDATDRLFVVGNGISSSNKSDALVIYKDGNATLAGTLTQNSDRRLKKDISTLSYGLNEILRLKPVEYHWKENQREQKSLGLIAQDVQLVINNIVKTGQDEKELLSISYIELVPVLVKALQEQQTMIQELKAEVAAMKQ